MTHAAPGSGASAPTQRQARAHGKRPASVGEPEQDESGKALGCFQ